MWHFPSLLHSTQVYFQIHFHSKLLMRPWPILPYSWLPSPSICLLAETHCSVSKICLSRNEEGCCLCWLTWVVVNCWNQQSLGLSTTEVYFSLTKWVDVGWQQTGQCRDHAWCLDVSAVPLVLRMLRWLSYRWHAGKQRGALVGHERSQGLGLEAASLTSIHISQETVQSWELAWLWGIKEEDKK